MRIGRILLSTLILSSFAVLTYGQSGKGSRSLTAVDQNRLSLALSTPGYPLTPGDLLTITYLSSTETPVLTGIVDAGYSLDIGIFGEVDVRNKTYLEVRSVVIDLVKQIYPKSYPRVELARVGSFYVTIRGAVTRPGEMAVWGLMRLSDVVDERIAGYGSDRSVTLLRANGETRTSDLYIAKRDGDAEQNPYLLPGDVIDVGDSVKRVELSGAVARPGIYEILSSDSFEKVIEEHGGGITPRGDASALVVTRHSENSAILSIVVDYRDQTSRSRLPENSDIITVHPLAERLPVVYLEGAISASTQREGAIFASTQREGAISASTQRVRIPIYSGDTLYSTLSRSQRLISPAADLSSGEIRREATIEPIKVDMERLLFQRDTSIDVALQPGDRVVLPFGTIEVFVWGAVHESGYFDSSALSRLEAFLDGRLTQHASTRNVRVTSSRGESAEYDLFKAKREGRIDQDPYLQPNDRVFVSQVDRRVAIRGEVIRAGSYELTRSDGLRDLIEYYADGTTDLADLGRIEITRINPVNGSMGERFVIAEGSGVELLNLDIVRIPSRLELQPVVYIEGAIMPEPIDRAALPDAGASNPEDTLIPSRARVAIRSGDTLLSVLKQIEDRIHQHADLANSFIHRTGLAEPFNVDIEALLYQQRYEQDVALGPGDRIVVPFGSARVFLSGQVHVAGSYVINSLTQLSQFLDGKLTQFASTRAVSITTASGQNDIFDLFLAKRFGRIDHDPYLKPGDQISIGHLTRSVLIRGEIERPGLYELLPGDGIENLISYYGDGKTDLADLSRVEIMRSKTGNERPSELFVVDAVSQPELELKNQDLVTVPNRLDQLPVVYIEGAIKAGDPAQQFPTQQSSTQLAPSRMRIFLRSGETLYSVLNRSRDRIDDRGDLSRALIRRAGASNSIEIDMEKLLFQGKLSNDVTLEAGDRIVVPFGTSEVFLTGEVLRSEWITVEPLTRLSEVVLERLTEYSSSRMVSVVSRNGDKRTYDLFLVERFGRKEEDPYLQSGDTIHVDRSSRKITIEGEVERPGTYDLLEAETLRDLVEFYGGGFTTTGNQSALKVVSLETGGDTISEKVYVDYREQPETIQLRDRDAVTVPSKLAQMPYVVFEGAVTVQGEEGVATTALDSASQFRYRFHSGELLSEALARLEYRFSPESDLANAYAVGSDGKRRAIDMEALLRRAESAEDISLKANDQFVIPFKQFFVIVAGAVQNPGRFPYIPNRGFRYYVDLAGGYDTQLHLGNAVLITDITNRPVPQGETIAPEMKIYAPINNPLYFVNQLSGVLGVIGTILSILTVTGILGGSG